MIGVPEYSIVIPTRPDFNMNKSLTYNGCSIILPHKRQGQAKTCC